MRYLIVVDMQNDFIDGALGSPEAQNCVPFVVQRIGEADQVFVTMDTHYDNYMETLEGQKLPVPHCIHATDGWAINSEVKEALNNKPYFTVCKPTFGSLELIEALDDFIKPDDIIELCGVCTDICVISNALLLRAKFPDNKIEVYTKACAGSSVLAHADALSVMRSCQIDTIY